VKMSAAGLKALMEREGVRNAAYPDPHTGGAPWTIGVGHTGPEVHPGLWWDNETVMAALAKDVKKFETAIDHLVHVPLTQNQHDALVSMVHNVGEGDDDGPGDGDFASSTLLRKLNAGDYAGASREFRKWIVPAMITSRRAGEWVQFNTPDGQPYPARSKFDDRYP
jgi:lysozyme